MVSKPIFELQMEILTSKSARVCQGVVAESVLLRLSADGAIKQIMFLLGHYPGRGRALVTEMTFYDASRRSWCTIGAPPCPAPPAARGPPAASLPAGGSRTERQTIKAAYDLAARGPRDAARMLRGATGACAPYMHAQQLAINPTCAFRPSQGTEFCQPKLKLTSGLTSGQVDLLRRRGGAGAPLTGERGPQDAAGGGAGGARRRWGRWQQSGRGRRRAQRLRDRL